MLREFLNFTSTAVPTLISAVLLKENPQNPKLSQDIINHEHSDLIDDIQSEHRNNYLIITSILCASLMVFFRLLYKNLRGVSRATSNLNGIIENALEDGKITSQELRGIQVGLERLESKVDRTLADITSADTFIDGLVGVSLETLHDVPPIEPLPHEPRASFSRRKSSLGLEARRANLQPSTSIDIDSFLRGISVDRAEPAMDTVF